MEDGSDVKTFTSGAKSSAQLAPLHLVPFEIFEDRLARRYELGAYIKGYGEGNWQKGVDAWDRAFILDRLNHTTKHLHRVVEQIRAGDFESWEKTDDDAAAVIWGAIMIMYVQQKAKERFHYDRRENLLSGGGGTQGPLPADIVVGSRAGTGQLGTQPVHGAAWPSPRENPVRVVPVRRPDLDPPTGER